jgi:hypothetical protein
MAAGFAGAVALLRRFFMRWRSFSVLRMRRFGRMTALFSSRTVLLGVSAAGNKTKNSTSTYSDDFFHGES